LPYADGAVDAIHVEAVLEHLEFPGRAVAEMFRVLRSGGEIFAATPFLQGFHGYPSHYQNFTRVGHDRLFERAGFEVVISGACVGPTYALSDLASLYLRHYLPGRILSRGAQRAVTLASLLVRPLDRHLHRRPEAELLASSVYARLRKPRGR
ncbi:MAG: methyltransferase domain-containing protein, partial [Holophagales bacterium]|nr:methyltransferase domain-containing protein [Holophagales bacterium]